MHAAKHNTTQRQKQQIGPHRRSSGRSGGRNPSRISCRQTKWSERRAMRSRTGSTSTHSPPCCRWHKLRCSWWSCQRPCRFCHGCSSTCSPVAVGVDVCMYVCVCVRERETEREREKERRDQTHTHTQACLFDLPSLAISQILQKKFGTVIEFRISKKKSLYLFTPQDRFRAFCISVVSNALFEYLVLLVIAINCIFLALNNPPEEAE